MFIVIEFLVEELMKVKSLGLALGIVGFATTISYAGSNEIKLDNELHKEIDSIVAEYQKVDYRPIDLTSYARDFNNTYFMESINPYLKNMKEKESSYSDSTVNYEQKNVEVAKKEKEVEKKDSSNKDLNTEVALKTNKGNDKVRKKAEVKENKAIEEEKRDYQVEDLTRKAGVAKSASKQDKNTLIRKYYREVKRETIKFNVVRISNSNLDEGVERVKTQGRVGFVDVTYQTEYLDGVNKGTKVVARKKVQDEIDKVIEYGTKKKNTQVNKNKKNLDNIVKRAYQLVGSQYRFAAAGPNAFDCSGLTYYLYKTEAGITLNRIAEDQARNGRGVALKDIRPGDIVLFYNSGTYIGHAAIYVGDGKIVHASSSKTGVIVSNFFNTSRYLKVAAVRRIIE